MRIPELFTRGAPVFSFEFFLPRSEPEWKRFRKAVENLKRLEPGFVSMTYGAGGTEKGATLEAAGMIKGELGLETAAHLTCISHTRGEILELLGRIRSMGIENIVALRGDRPIGSPPLPIETADFAYAVDLVRTIRADFDEFAVAVAGYPEKHPEAQSMESDLVRLREKVDSGADWVITQLFFDNRDYFEFVRRVRELGIRCPVVPGIMPVTNFAQIRRFTSLCGASIPEGMHKELERIADDKEAVMAYGIEHAVRQCRELLDGGAPGIHFYTLNKSRATATILSELRKAG